MTKAKLVFDTGALLAFYLDKEGSQRVLDSLKEVIDGKADGCLNIVNLTELFCIICRKNRKLADEKVRNLRSFGLKIIPVKYGALWRDAAMLMAEHDLSLGDAFAAATAMTLKAKLVTGDSGFYHISGLRIERIH